MLRCFCFVFFFFCFVHAVFQPGFHTFNENSIYWTSWYFPEFIVSHQQVHTSGRSALFSDSLPHFISEFTVNVTTLILVSLFSESFQWRQVFFSWIWWHDGKRQRPLEVTQGTTGFTDWVPPAPFFTHLHFPSFHVPTCICAVLLGDTEGAVLPPHWNVCLLPN